MLMSYLSSIGTVKAGSGLTEVLELCYGSNTVNHMLSGKAVSRALRGLLIVDAALQAVLLHTIGANDDDCVTGMDSVEFEITQVYEQLLAGCQEDVFTSEDTASAMQKLQETVSNFKGELSQRSRTAKLWFQFMYRMETVRLFIRAEHLSDWSLHEYAAARMLNLFAASGHFSYAKSGRLYVQMVQDLPDSHPWLYDQFANHGLQSVRRSDRQWAGIWTDLVIEQLLMRSVKSRGCLTCGRGFSESVRMTWVHTMHRCAGVHQTMTTITGLQHATSDQHVEMRNSRVKRDMMDQEKMVKWFQCHNPFCAVSASLCSLSTGLTACDDSDVTCDEAEKIGEKIQSYGWLLFLRNKIAKEGHCQVSSDSGKRGCCR